MLETDPYNFAVEHPCTWRARKDWSRRGFFVALLTLRFRLARAYWAAWRSSAMGLKIAEQLLKQREARYVREIIH